jgi:hypothetical protein
MASHATFQCAFCASAALEKCGRCKTHYYCSKDCQKSDFLKHKGVCKDIQLEKSLERAAVIIQQAYLKFRENTWDTPVIKIEDTGHALVVYDGMTPSKSTYFVDFPNHLINNEKDKMAVLCTWVCNEPFAQMHSMLRELLHSQIRSASMTSNDTD